MKKKFGLKPRFLLNHMSKIVSYSNCYDQSNYNFLLSPEILLWKFAQRLLIMVVKQFMHTFSLSSLIKERKKLVSLWSSDTHPIVMEVCSRLIMVVKQFMNTFSLSSLIKERKQMVSLWSSNTYPIDPACQSTCFLLLSKIHDPVKRPNYLQYNSAK